MTRKSGFATLDAVVQLVLCIDSSKLESERKVIQNLLLLLQDLHQIVETSVAHFVKHQVWPLRYFRKCRTISSESKIVTVLQHRRPTVSLLTHTVPSKSKKAFAKLIYLHMWHSSL